MSPRQNLDARVFCSQFMGRPLFLLANQEEGRYSNTLPAPLISPTARLIRLLWPDLHPGDYLHEEFRSPSIVYSPTALALPPPPLDSRAPMWTHSQLFSALVHANTSTSRIEDCFCMGPKVFCQVGWVISSNTINVVLRTEAEIGDIKRARNLFDSLVQSHLQHAPG
ncbi:hypothetical protein EDB19DRAFT_1916531 [Suillus lakei]|nr:hypothetical protein EDB19DRAFT_1916531 [Suillus lakei]